MWSVTAPEMIELLVQRRELEPRAVRRSFVYDVLANGLLRPASSSDWAHADPGLIVELRRHMGKAELWLPPVTAVVIRGNDVLLVKRSDTGDWSPVTGIVDPDEDPGVAARREVLEETGRRRQRRPAGMGTCTANFDAT